MTEAYYWRSFSHGWEPTCTCLKTGWNVKVPGCPVTVDFLWIRVMMEGLTSFFVLSMTFDSGRLRVTRSETGETRGGVVRDSSSRLVCSFSAIDVRHFVDPCDPREHCVISFPARLSLYPSSLVIHVAVSRDYAADCSKVRTQKYTKTVFCATLNSINMHITGVDLAVGSQGRLSPPTTMALSPPRPRFSRSPFSPPPPRKQFLDILCAI